MKSEAKFKSDIRRYVRSIVEQDNNATQASTGISPDAKGFIAKLDSMAKSLATHYSKIDSSKEVKEAILAILNQFSADLNQEISGLNQALLQLKKENQPSTPDEKVITENKRALFLAGIITEAQYRK
jgi:hypothetical protein